MGYDGSGQFVRSHDWTDDRDAGIKIRADRMDEEDDGFATGLSNCVTKDGQTTPTANLPMGGFKHTNVADSSARNHYAATGQVQDAAFTWAGTDIGAADAYEFSLDPSITAYAAGQVFRGTIGTGNTNTGASTIKFDALSTKNIKLVDGTDPPAGAMGAGRSYSWLYDGTDFVLLDPSLNPNAAFESGTRMVFQQTSAPTGWTKETGAEFNDVAMRIVTGTVGSETGQQTFSTVFAKTATDEHTLTASQIPAHNHTININDPGHNHNLGANNSNGDSLPGGSLLANATSNGGNMYRDGNPNRTLDSNSISSETTGISASSDNSGGGSSHSHDMDIRVNRQDVIVAAKD